MKNIIKLTNDFILKSGIKKLPLEIDDLGDVCNSLGYRLLSYQEAESIIEKFGVRKNTEFPAFVLVVGKGKLVLFDSTRSTSTRIFAIAHEIGHIVLKHNYQGVVGYSEADSDQEREANTFAYQLLAPLCVLRAMNITDMADIETNTLLDKNYAKTVHTALHHYKKQPRADELVVAYGIRLPKKRFNFSLVVALLVAALCIASVFIRVVPPLQEPTEATSEFLEELKTKQEALNPSVDPTADVSETVYITRYGERYHKQQCYHIKDRMVTALTVSEAVEDGYTPCKTCFK